MALDLGVTTQGSFPARLTMAIEGTIDPKTRGSRDADAFFSQSFVRRHTDFESLEAFCRACPCERDSVGGIQRLAPDERDEFVAATTDFETWSEMKQTAAVTDLVTLLGG
jgi:hypothetical protein